MQRSDFHFNLPAALIAQHPVAKRSDSRLLNLDRQTGTVSHGYFRQLIDLLTPGDLLVFNDTQVIPARLYGHKQTGGKVEVLIERVLDTKSVWVHIRASKAPKPGSVILLEQRIALTVIARQGDIWLAHFHDKRSVWEILALIGQLPLPPYIQREVIAQDWQRYQTVYANKRGAIASPTAGLHFDDDMLDDLRNTGVNFATITLHIGAGTFQPVRVAALPQHKMHYEYAIVDQQTCDMIKSTKASGKRVIAVGTTVVRALETAAHNGQMQPFMGDTNIFIYPGYHFHMVDGMVTNLHLPESTLLMLVCAFADYQYTLAAYQAAIAAQYRFYSYGDAMIIL